MPTTLSRNLASRVVGLGVGVVVAMAPFLGRVSVPGFEALYNLLPFQVQSEIVGLSAFVVGLVTVTLQFYAAEKVSRRVLRKIFKRGLFAVLALFGGFVILTVVFTEPVRRGDKTVVVMVGLSRIPTCQCTTAVDKECIEELSFNEAAIESCWGSGPLKVIKVLFIFLYLALTSGFVILVGLDLLRRADKQPRPERSINESRNPPTDTDPLPRRKKSPQESAARRELERKREEGVFDVFLCHNSADKPAVKRIGRQLEDHGILPWLDEWELRPGQPWQVLLEQQIGKIKSAAVFFGPAGVGPWQEQELRGFLSEFVGRKCPVIPVLLPEAPEKPELPIFLKGMTWVDFRVPDRDPLERLIWGITGERPEGLGE